MTSPTPDLVVSGVPFPVREVDGRAPSSLEDFLGDATLVLEDRSGPRSVTGTGHQDGDAVRVHEKAAGTGKDVRVWCVRSAGDGFTAETV
jgi:hypothetical protein